MAAVPSTGVGLVAGIAAVVAGIVLLIIAAPRRRRPDSRVGRYLGAKTILNAVLLFALGIFLIIRS